ncbi:MAG: hypothetical protein D6790_19435 [Caldilineae bacterium]|nr:MAG: hypothetical protein D6790_19435 [Caldilineae bacterium]
MDDGRNFLLRTPYRYDIITTDATHPTNTSSWALFTVEFYRSVAEHLTEKGVFIQWVPFHSLRETDYKMILRTFSTVFPNATLWYTGGSHTLLVATSEPITDETLDRLVAAAAQDPITAQDLERPTALRAFLAMGPQTLRAYAGEGPLSTDDRAYFLPDNAEVEQIRSHIQTLQTQTLEKGLDRD